MTERVLVIKLGALGDFVLALGPFAAIRQAHPNARITLLTTGPFEDFARASGYFDDVWIDRRPSTSQISGWLELRRRLRGGRFERVYDLQTSDRSGWYYRLMGPGARPDWSGIAPGCSHPHDNPDRDHMHTIERQTEQLARAGIKHVPAADLTWVEADIARFALAGRFALLAPGGAAHRRAKRWPAENYAELAAWLVGQGVTPVILGGGDERDLAREITSVCAGARNLVGETGLGDIVALARAAATAIGNDTGPMHLIAAAGCPTLVLFSEASDPALTRPRGPKVNVLERKNLGDLGVSDVVASAILV